MVPVAVGTAIQSDGEGEPQSRSLGERLPNMVPCASMALESDLVAPVKGLFTSHRRAGLAQSGRKEAR